MKTITLKLTKSEFETIESIHIIGFDYNYYNDYSIAFNEDVNNVRKCLNDEIDKCFPLTEDGMGQMPSAPNGRFYEGSESQKRDNLKSILAKLDREVK